MDKHNTLAAWNQGLFFVLLLLSTANLSLVMAGPSGGQVVGGTGSITHSSNTTTINQTTHHYH